MNYAITVGYHDAFEKALVVFRGVEENLPVIAELGYGGIELAIFDRSNVEDSTAMKTLLRRYGLELPVISTGQVLTMREVYFTHRDKEVRDRAVEIFSEIMDLGGEFDADINISRIRGSIPEGDTLEQALSRLSACLEPLCVKAEKLGISLVLEQMNRFETNYLLSVQEIAEYIRGTGFPALKIHADTFHMNIEDVDMTGILEEHRDLLGYIHFADSNRLAPGWGHTDFDSFLRCLHGVGYEGWIGIEVLPQPDAVSAARQAITYLKEREKEIEYG